MIRAAALALLLTLVGTSASAKEAKLTGFDALARKGRKVVLKAKLETKGIMGIDPDVKGASLDFFVTQKDGADLKKPDFLGTGKTNDDGIATVDWKPDAAGRYTVEARVRAPLKYLLRRPLDKELVAPRTAAGGSGGARTDPKATGSPSSGGDAP